MDYNVIDADGHICEPPDLWEKYIDPKFREGCPKLITAGDGSEVLRIEGDYAIDLGHGKKKVSFGAIGCDWLAGRQGLAKNPLLGGAQGRLRSACPYPRHGCRGHRRDVSLPEPRAFPRRDKGS